MDKTSNTKYRILHTEWSDGWGGQERRIISEMAGMAERGHHMVLATRPQCQIAKRAEQIGVPVLLLPMRRTFDLASIFALARYLRRESIQVVNTHSGIDSWIGAIAAKFARTPILIRTRHLNIPLRRNWLNFVHYLPDQIVSCGMAMRTQLVEGCGFPLEHVTNIPTGIDFEKFKANLSREKVRHDLGISEDKFLILMVGIIRSVKRHVTALEAHKLLLEQIPNAHLLVVGDGPIRDEMENFGHELGISQSVTFTGYREDIPELMRASDTFLLTSRSEGVPQAITQALGMGLAVVATSVGGVPELILHEKTGILVPVENPEAIRDGLVRMATNPADAKRMGAEAKLHVLEQFSLRAMLDKTETLLRDLIRS